MRTQLKRPVLVAMLALLLGSGCSDQDAGRKKPLVLYGNIDIREVQLAFQDSGRILSTAVDEGARVEAGQVVAELDPVRFRMDLDRLDGEVAAQRQVLERLRTGSRPQEIAAARAEVAAAKANLHEAELVLARKQTLRVTNKISRQEVDSAEARMQTWRASLRSAEERLSMAVEGPRKEDIAAAAASLKALEAGRALAARRLHDAKLRAPAAGFIRNRILEPGSMAAPGAPVFILALTNPLWARAYIAEPDLGRIRVGMRATLSTDTFPDKVYEGWVGFISSTAEFTPKTVETSELRTKLVYRARIFACDPNHELRLGMPVTVRIDTDQPPERTGEALQCP